MDDFENVREFFDAFVRKELCDLFTELFAKSGTELIALDGLRFAGVTICTDDVGDVVPDKLVVGDGLHAAVSLFLRTSEERP